MARLTFTICMMLSLLPLPAQAQERVPVDVQLVLGADISASMTPDELKVQREGYAAALTDDAVLNAIRSGAYGKIAVTYFEWAGVTSQNVVVPWTVIAAPADAEAVARGIAVPPTWQSRRTSISGAMNFAAGLLDASPYKGIKRVIDLSGDGANNEGPPLVETRDAITAQGITINGLPVMTADAAPQPYDVPNLDKYFSECVIGGPAAFVMPVHEWEQFPEAIRRKLLLELAIRPQDPGRRPPVMLIQAKPAYDCLIGEKLWRQDDRKHFFNPENDYRRRGTP
ncbi:DUF1194 domain-containing protein [Mesorhizobium sp. CN2-181]|uniref:DUF1194 domain-containing protein n=1 Tax=Mesorhizobium yinganensis TaxID=3157707 RepID=UPI0032B86D35